MRMVKVWDPLVRVLHWGLVASFAIAFITADELRGVHEWAGYVLVAIVGLRIAWGLIGSRHARFVDFVYRPGTVLAFLRDTLRFRAVRYLGHNPAGGAMVIALLLTLAVIATTGIMMESTAFWGEEWVEEVHEACANIALALVVLHIAGVLLASVEHGENLVRAMITGRKRPL